MSDGGGAAKAGAGGAGRFVATTLLGGVAFLLPFGLALIILTKLVEMVRPTGDAFRALVLPGAASEPAASIFTVLLLIAVAFASGLFVRGPTGARLFARMEEAFLSRLPFYQFLRRRLHDPSSGAASFAGEGGDEVVLVRLDDLTSIGFVVDRLHDGRAVVYLPGAPSALSGDVAIVEQERLTATSLTVTDVFGRMHRLGAGLDKILRRE